MTTWISTVRRIMLCGAFAAGVLSFPAIGQVSFSIDIGTPPPPPRVVAAPPPRPGYVWGPGYWRWDGHRYAWADGRWIAERPGYRWVPERWDERGGRHHFEPGRWEHVASREDERHFERERDEDRDRH